MSGLKGNNSKAPAQPAVTPAPATTPKQPAMPAPTPAVPEPESLKAAPPPLTFSNKMMHSSELLKPQPATPADGDINQKDEPFKPAAEASDQPNLAPEEQKSESTAKIKKAIILSKNF